MKNKIRNFLLRALPYLVSIAGGIALFSISLDNVKDPAVEALISNISASLLAIPLVFLLYDYTTTRVSRRLRATMLAGMNDKINTIMLHLVLTIAKIMRMREHPTHRKVITMRSWSESHIEHKMQIRGEYLTLIHQYYDEMENLVLAFGKENALAPEQVRLLSALSRDMSRIVAMHKLGETRRIVARHIKNIIGEINDWLDSNPDASADFDKILANATGTSDQSAKNVEIK